MDFKICLSVPALLHILLSCFVVFVANKWWWWWWWSASCNLFNANQFDWGQVQVIECFHFRGKENVDDSSVGSKKCPLTALIHSYKVFNGVPVVAYFCIMPWRKSVKNPDCLQHVLKSRSVICWYISIILREIFKRNKIRRILWPFVLVKEVRVIMTIHIFSTV